MGGRKDDRATHRTTDPVADRRRDRRLHRLLGDALALPPLDQGGRLRAHRLSWRTRGDRRRRLRLADHPRHHAGQHEHRSAAGGAQQGRGADWNWYTILDGHAIQDDWISPSLSVEVEEGKRGFGTNIRIYNPTDKRWNQIWVSSNSRKFDNFTATFIDGKIVMRGFYVGNETRVTFYDMKENTFDWKMEFQDKDNPEVWKEVYRIHGDRKK